MTNPIIILGSSRSFGNTRKAVMEIMGGNASVLVDLQTLNIKPYDYEYHNKDDDFMPLMARIVEHDIIVLATPVYWYTMSATMKIFIDRISDLLDLRKDIGRKLKGKKLFVIASFSTSLPNGFEEVFAQTCEYLGIYYLGTSFIYSGTKNENFLKNNQLELKKAKSLLIQSPV